jgi:hypothetical protein
METPCSGGPTLRQAFRAMGRANKPAAPGSIDVNRRFIFYSLSPVKAIPRVICCSKMRNMMIAGIEATIFPVIVITRSVA